MSRIINAAIGLICISLAGLLIQRLVGNTTDSNGSISDSIDTDSTDTN